MRIVITGAQGQLGQALIQQWSAMHDVFALSRTDMDVTDAKCVHSIINEIQPDVVIHTAAYTAVDQAEDEREQTYAVNVEGTRHIAKSAQHVGAVCCYMSTDYVFNGQLGRPYKEEDQPNPLSYYGYTKFRGEQIVRAVCQKYFIIRTSWLYGLGGANFVTTMLKVAEQGAPIRVVNDQIGSPTYVRDLTEFMKQLVASERYGLYHASNSGSCSWYEFAQAIFTINEELGLGQQDWQLIPCSTVEYPRKALRPTYSVLAHDALREAGFEGLRHWREALRAFLLELGSCR